MNAVGMFLEEAEEKDYLGILSFITLSYILVPFQAYASVKGFLEKEEGPWFRTPKTGKITDILVRGRFYRWIAGILPGRRPALGGVAASRLAPAPAWQGSAFSVERLGINPYVALATANNRFNQFRVKPRRIRGLANLVIVSLLLVSLVLSYVAIPLSPVAAFEGQFLFRDTGADVLSDETTSPRKKMSRGDAGGTAYSVTLQATPPDANTYFFHDDLASSVSLPTAENATSSAALADTTMYGSQRHLHRDKYGNLIFVHINTNSDIVATFKNFDASDWSSAVMLDAGTVLNVSSALDNSGNLQIAWEGDNAAGDESIYFKRVPVLRNASNQITGFTTSESVVTLLDAPSGGKDLQRRPAVIIDHNGWPVVVWGRATSGGTKDSGVRISRSCSADNSSDESYWEEPDYDCDNYATTTTAQVETIVDFNTKVEVHVMLGRMPGSGSNLDGLYVFASHPEDSELYAWKYTVDSSDTKNYNTVAVLYDGSDNISLGTDTTASPYSFSITRDLVNGALVYIYAGSSNYSTIKRLDSSDSETDLSPTTTDWGDSYSLFSASPSASLLDHYTLYKNSSGNIGYRYADGANFGNSAGSLTGGSSNLSIADTMAAKRVNVSAGGAFSNINLRAETCSAVRTAVYTDDSGTPGSLVAQTEEKSTLANEINTFYFDKLVTLSSGFYWLAVVASSTCNAYGDPVGGTSYTATYPGGDYTSGDNFPLTFPSGSSDSFRIRMEAKVSWMKEIVLDSGTSNTFPSARDEDEGSGENMGGRVDVAYYNGSNVVKYNYVPLFKDSTTAEGATSAKEQTIGATGWDYLYFLSGTLSGLNNFSSDDWEVNVCVGSTYTANEDIYVRWEVVDTDGITIQESSSESTWSSSTGSTQQCSGDGGGAEDDVTLSPPTGIDNLNGYRLRLRLRYGNDGDDAIPVRYDWNSTNDADAYIKFYTSGGADTDTYYVLTDNFNKKWTSGDVEMHSDTGDEEQRNIDIATDSSGNTIAVWEDERNSGSLSTFSEISDRTEDDRSSHTANLLNNGKVLLAGGNTSSITSTSIAELYDPVTNTFTEISDRMSSDRAMFTATLLNNGKVLIAGGYFWIEGTRNFSSTAELYDSAADTFTEISDRLDSPRSAHTATLLNNGKVLVVGGFYFSGGNIYLSTAELYDPATNTFDPISDRMDSSRYAHTSTLLNSGKVLITGGSTGGVSLSMAEIYDPATNTFTEISNRMSSTRSYHSATLLNSGKVLLVGASSGAGQSVAELFDPAADTFTEISDRLDYPRYYHNATLLNSGKVLVVGTFIENAGQSVAELYDPATNTFTEISNRLDYPRINHTETILNNGKVLIVGGTVTGPGAGQSVAELYSPKTADIYAQKYNNANPPVAQWGSDIKVNSDVGNASTSGYPNYDHLNPQVKLDSEGDAIVTWQEARNSVYGDDIWAQKLDTDDGSKMWPDATTDTWSEISDRMDYPRYYHTATLLNNGKVLVAGTHYSNAGQSVAELYDPAIDSWSEVSDRLSYPRSYYTATLLNSGEVLIVGSGISGSGGYTVAEIYDPVSNEFSVADTLSYIRLAHTATLLNNGQVLVVGTNGSNRGQSVAEIYDPATDSWSEISDLLSYRRSYHTATLLNNGQVLIVGTSLGVGGQSVAELYDPITNTFTEIDDRLAHRRTLHTSTLLNNGKVLIAGQSAAIGQAGQSVAELYDPATSTFSEVSGRLSYSRDRLTLTLLNNGKVLIVGTGFTNRGQSAAELYDPATNTFSEVATQSYLRKEHTVTLLNNGKVLVVGTGFTDAGRSVAELYLPAGDVQVSNDGSPTNGDGMPRPEHPNNGRGILGEQRNPVLAIDSADNVIIAWEDTRFNAVRNASVSAQIYTRNKAALGLCNGGGGTNNSCGAMSALAGGPLRIMGQKLASSDGAREWGDDLDDVNKNNPEDLGLSSTGDINQHPVLDVSNTDIVLAWDSNSAIEAEDSNMKREANIYAQKFDSTGSSLWGSEFEEVEEGSDYIRSLHTATLLDNGRLLIVGSGIDDFGKITPEIFDPSNSSWSPGGSLTYARKNHTATLLNNGKVLVVGTSENNAGQSVAELYDPSDDSWSSGGILTHARNLHTATLLNNGKVLITGASVASPGQSTAEIYDPSDGSWSSGGDMTYNHGSQATLLNDGKVLIVGGPLTSVGQSVAELYDPTTNTFSPIADRLDYSRNYHTETILNNGKVLIVGTLFSSAGRSVAELYDPTTNTFTEISDRLDYPRYDHTATLLNNGKVLVVGSGDTTNGAQTVAELYDPATQTFSEVADRLAYPREDFATTLLNNGEVLVVGTSETNAGRTVAELFSLDQMINTGVDLAEQINPAVVATSSSSLLFAWQGMRGHGDGGGASNDSGVRGGGNYQIYGMKTDNPSSGSLTNQWPSGTTDVFSEISDRLDYPREDHIATLLNNGKVLVVGGGDDDASRSTAEIYDPAADSWSSSGSMSYARRNHTATLLYNGKALIVGTNQSNAGQSVAELYDPASNTFSEITDRLDYPRSLHTATLLNNGKVLVVGSLASNDGTSIAELYDPSTNTFSEITDRLDYPRRSHTTTLLNNGKVLVVGTSVIADAGRSVAELYDPSTNTFSEIPDRLAYPRAGHTATLLNNGKVLMVASSVSGAGQSVAELYDLSTNTFSEITDRLDYPRSSHTTTLLNNGEVIVVGTGFSNAGRSVAELYDPATNIFSEIDDRHLDRAFQTATLLNNGKVLVVGTSESNRGLSVAELYLPSGELALSHDFGLAGDQEKPQIATSSASSDFYVVWEDNRAATTSATITEAEINKNIYMQKFDGSTGSPQWPAAETTGTYTSPYSVSDVRVDTHPGGTQYSGKPVIGGIYTHPTDNTETMVIGWEDNRNASTDLMDVYAQTYDLAEYNIAQDTNWLVYFYVDSASSADLDVGVDIMESDGMRVASASAEQNWTTATGMQTKTFATGSYPNPPSDEVGNVTMRRLRVTFTRNSGSVTIEYDDELPTDKRSRLTTGDIVPEKNLVLAMIMPFLPPVVRWYRRRKKKQ
jgi:N-acetylneuraminic acid mutarotase